jgi:ubiquitin carboxyl-terminal hydrolase L5
MGNWLDVVRPVIKMRMKQLSGSGDIRFNLLAVVDGVYEARSDDLELLKRERVMIEKRLGDNWQEKVVWSLTCHILSYS